MFEIAGGILLAILILFLLANFQIVIGFGVLIIVGALGLLLFAEYTEFILIVGAMFAFYLVYENYQNQKYKNIKYQPTQEKLRKIIELTKFDENRVYSAQNIRVLNKKYVKNGYEIDIFQEHTFLGKKITTVTIKKNSGSIILNSVISGEDKLLECVSELSKMSQSDFSELNSMIFSVLDDLQK